ncbi:MAG: sulfotransferase [Chloroflexi bacterium]|nr:sulfotransferase [Chloroflexota bacterium]
MQTLHQTLFTYLCGMDARDWLRLLQENRFAVDPEYWPRAAAITASTIRTTIRRTTEDARFGPAVAETEVQAPLFVLGFGRSGTTHLHRLLAQDSQFGYPNLYQTTRPHSFLLTEASLAPRLASWLARTRPQDNVALRVDAPEEDEVALTLMTRCSPRLARVFPRHWGRYSPYLTFHEVTDEERSRWKAAFVWFAKKLTWKHRRPLVLKSPPHTGRIRLLLELFPDARFVHIHRHPYDVFRSARHGFSSTRNRNALQHEAARQAEETVVRRYRETYDAFFEQKASIPRGNFCEIRFEDVEQDPLGQVEQIYRTLGVPRSKDLEARLRHYLESITGYRKNVHPPLDPSERRRLASAWRRSFEEWGYLA